MVYLRRAVIVICCFTLFASVSAFGDSDVVTKSFPAKAYVRVTLVSGEGVIRTGTADKITVEVDYSYEFSRGGNYTPEMAEEGDELILEELMSGSCRGSSTWTITVPENTGIRFSSASGGLKAKGLYGQLNAETGSGDYLIEDCTGRIRLSTGSGRIEISRLSGEITAITGSGDIEADEIKGGLELTSGSGEVEATGISLIEAGAFASGSGDAEITLAASPLADVAVSSGSGDAVLRYNGNPILGSFVFTAKYNEGKIKAPFAFEEEKTVRKQGQEYVYKSFTRESESPEISIRTGTGTAMLVK